jgi:hypothetical protein
VFFGVMARKREGELLLILIFVPNCLAPQLSALESRFELTISSSSLLEGALGLGNIHIVMFSSGCRVKCKLNLMQQAAALLSNSPSLLP